MKISTVVVGRNEGHKLKMCLDSLIKCREYLKESHEFEIIYVDSDSSDESIPVAVNSGIDHVIRISGEINSAVARNVGAARATFEWLFFVDGDMVIHPGFFREPIVEKFFETEEFFSGQFINVFYDSDWKELSREKFSENPTIKLDPAPGGLFIVKTEIWRTLGGMKDHYKRSQDFEFGLRCYQAGHIFKRINRLLATHHTISYLDFKRNLTFFKGNNYLYSRSMLYRDHIMKNLNRNCLKIFMRQDYSLIALIVSLLLTPFFGWKALLLYVFAAVVRSVRNYKKGLLFYFCYIIVRDVSVFFGFFFFHPSKKLDYTIENVR